MAIDTTVIANTGVPQSGNQPHIIQSVVPSGETTQQNQSPVFVERGVGNDPDNLTPDAYDEDLKKYFLPENWPQPAWLLNEMSYSALQLRERDYEDYVLSNLRWRYLRLELDFRTSLNSFYNSPYFDKTIAARIISFLSVSRSALELKTGDPLNARSLLDLIDENMVWLFPPHYTKEMATSLIADLKADKNIWGGYLETEMNRDGQTLGGLRAAIQNVKEKLNKVGRETEINTGLHIDQLKKLIVAGLVVLVVLLVGLPFFLDESSKIVVDIFKKFTSMQYKPWITVLCTALVGTIGAFLSGLLQVRRSQVKIGEYRESIIQFQLRPVVGAIVSSFVGVLLTWNAIGIEVSNVGVYLLIIFTCGFSERYFLNLLKINDSDGTVATQQQTPIVAVNTPAGGSEDAAAERGMGKPVPRKAVEDLGDVNTRKL